jgi:hypothetical protein
VKKIFRFTAELWEWTARDNWFFVSLPVDDSAEIQDRPLPPSGFGAVKVRATIGKTEWVTSIFPGSHTQGYSLPVKKSVRVAEGIQPLDRVEVKVELVD